MTAPLQAGQLRRLLESSGEVALIDVREQGVYSRAHLFFAVCVSLSRLEIDMPRVAPRRSVPVVLCDDGNSDNAMAHLAADRLSALGYSDITILAGGPAQWQEAGLEIYSGVNVPSKAFGEFVEHWYDTPRLPASDLQAMRNRGENLVILDSRPMDEYQRMNIPGGVDCPGAELVYRVHEMAPDPSTKVVVNCAGRTRSIIGAQSLINAGLPNEVFALKDGTMGWELAGLSVERGRTDHAPEPGPDGLQIAEQRAAQVAQRFGVRRATVAQLEQWQDAHDRTTMLLDVRTAAEFNAGHWPGAQHAPGGQLVQATDEYVATRGARLVIVDGDDGVRATITAHWLIQAGWPEVWVFAQTPERPAVARTAPSQAQIDSLTLAAPISALQLRQAKESGDSVALIDFSTSLQFRAAHVPGAFWAIRSRITECVARLTQLHGDVQHIVMMAHDDLLAHLAARDLAADLAGGSTAQAALVQVSVLSGGLSAWRSVGGETEQGIETALTDIDDVWFKPYDHSANQSDAMQAYLTWEVGLVDQVKREGLAAFRRFD